MVRIVETTSLGVVLVASGRVVNLNNVEEIEKDGQAARLYYASGRERLLSTNESIELVEFLRCLPGWEGAFA